MIPWRSLFVFLGISAGTTAAIAVLCVVNGWTVRSPAWGVLAPIAMWAPALGRVVARRTVDRGFTSTLPLARWGATGAAVILMPLVVPLAVYGAAYAIAWTTGLAHWSPGGGRWTTGRQIAVNLLVNLPILGVVGTFTALGEEIGWRGYLQPRLDAAGVRASVAIVWLCQLAYHAPLMAGAGYANTGGLFTSLALFAAADLSLAFIWAHESYRARSLWPAVFFHSFHNTISQWLFPRLFAGGENELWLGESGLLPAAGYVVLGVALFVWMRQRGQPWRGLARRALPPFTTEHPMAAGEVQTRQAHPGDAPAIALAHLDSIRSIGRKFYGPEVVEAWGSGLTPDIYVKAMEGGEAFFIAAGHIDGEPAVLGFSTHRVDRGQDGTSVYVRGAAARRGIGTALLQLAEAHALAHGATTIEIQASLAGVEFYKANGYKEIRHGEALLMSGRSMPCVFMRKRLTAL